jgi:hypothetical protein
MIISDFEESSKQCFYEQQQGQNFSATHKTIPLKVLTLMT